MAQQSSTTARAFDDASAVITIDGLTQTQRAAIRRAVARRNERMWNDETFVSIERGRIVVTVAAVSVDAADHDGRKAFPSQQNVADAAVSAAHSEARNLMAAIGRTFNYDVTVR